MKVKTMTLAERMLSVYVDGGRFDRARSLWAPSGVFQNKENSLSGSALSSLPSS